MAVGITKSTQRSLKGKVQKFREEITMLPWIKRKLSSACLPSLVPRNTGIPLFDVPVNCGKTNSWTLPPPLFLSLLISNLSCGSNWPKFEVGAGVTKLECCFCCSQVDLTSGAVCCRPDCCHVDVIRGLFCCLLLDEVSCRRLVPAACEGGAAVTKMECLDSWRKFCKSLIILGELLGDI